MTITFLPPKEVLCSLKNLESLTITGCFLLSTLGGIGALTSLKALKLIGCLNLNPSNDSLPSSLEMLKFRGCSDIDVTRPLDFGNLSCLEKLHIEGWDGRLEGLNSLTALNSLFLLHCPGINPSSPWDKYACELHDEVVVDNLLQLKLILSNESISSIKKLAIFNFGGESAYGEVFQSLTSLMELSVFGCNSTRLPKSLKNLASISYMILVDCPNLCELEELPRNLRQLEFMNCPILMEKLKMGVPYQVWCDEECTIVTFPTEEERNWS